MSDRLVISSVHAENFGLFSNHTLDLPDAPMVVIHGRNEVGKSTLTELITWLLVGPSTDSNVIQRLGKHEEILVGEMKGWLKGREFEARGAFRINEKQWSISARSERVYEIDGLLTPEQWLRQLKEIDRAALEGIYRLWGQQLHDGGDADSEMRRAGLGAIAMAIDPRVTVNHLVDTSKSVAKIGAGDASFKSISAELKEISQAVAVANNNIVEYNAKVSELAELESKVAGLDERVLISRRRGSNLESLQKLDELRVAESAAEINLREQPDAPEKWLPAVGEIHRLRAVIETCGGNREALAGARQEYAKRVSAAGLQPSTTPIQVIQQISIKPHNIGAVGKAVGEVDHATQAHKDAVGALAIEATKLSTARAEAMSAADELGVDLDRVEAAQLDSAERAFASANDGLIRAQNDLSHAQSDLNGAVATVAEAAKAVGLAEKRWEQLGVGIPAREWRRSGGNRIASTMGVSSLRRLAPIFVLAFAAIVALVLGEWVLVVLIALAAVIAWVAVPATAVLDFDPSVAEAADRVESSDQKLDFVTSVLAGAEITLAGCEEQLKEARKSVLGVGPSLGLDLPDNPLDIQAELEQWRVAAGLVDRFRLTSTSVAEAERRSETTATTERSRLAELESLLTGFGLPGGIGTAAAEKVANQYVEVAGQAEVVLGIEASAVDADSQLAELLGQVAGEVADWTLKDVSSTAEAATTTHQKHVEALQTVELAAGRISDLVGDNEELASLIAGGLDLASAEVEIDEIDRAVLQLDEERQGLAEQTGVVKKEIQRLGSEQQLADLRLRQGSLEEVQADIGFELASRRLAALVLQHVADEYERKNQPELIRDTGKLARSVADEWSGVEIRRDDDNSTSLMVNLTNGSAVPVASLSTGARALLYLSLRVAMAEHDTEMRGLALPLICDDPLVHLDDKRAVAAMQLLANASRSRQVVMFTCHERTMEVAESIGVATQRM